MLNNRDDDKFEGQEESEYHFSDEEVSFEPEMEPSKSAPVSTKPSFLSRLKGAKRLWISAVIFLVLIYVVYKMVTPSSSPPPLDIAPRPAQAPTIQAPPQSTAQIPQQTP